MQESWQMWGKAVTALLGEGHAKKSKLCLELGNKNVKKKFVTLCKRSKSRKFKTQPSWHFYCISAGELTYLKECHSGSISNSTILNSALFSQVVCRVNGSIHPLHSKKGCQVGCIRWDDDQSEEPPDTPYYTSGKSLRHQLRAWKQDKQMGENKIK